MSSQSETLKGLLSKNLPLHGLLELEIRKMPYGEMTVNVEVKNGIADLGTLNIVKNRRIRYEKYHKVDIKMDNGVY